MNTQSERRTHVVAGATGRIGGALVTHLLDHGEADVVAVARDRDALADLADQYGPRFHACAADLLDDAAIDTVRAAVPDQRVGLVVNAARSATPGGVDEAPPGHLAAAVDLKAGGLLRLVRAVEPRLGEGSRVIAVGGRLGYDADPRAAAAGVANAAVAMLVRQLAHALGPRGTSCHVVAPGAMARGEGSAFGTSDVGSGHAPQEPHAAAPIGQLPTVEDVVWMIGMLTDPAAAFLNGGSLIMDGGRRTAVP